ncbi:MAG: NAD(P)-binding domain-containing protein [Deltaproteobacteria bacterium]|nr:NAD(P)-binding domain-containing protein [Deltaproteobacteria bacterium]
MIVHTVGFIGGGRVTRIVLQGFQHAGRMPEHVFVSDLRKEAREKLKGQCPGVDTVEADNGRAAARDIVFLSLHPPAIGDVLAEI